MKITCATVCVLIGLFATVYGRKCKMPPSLWCSTGRTAIDCGVYEQCYNSLLQDVNAPPVNFALYYESLCPGCRDFFATQLHKTYLALGEEVLNLTLVPYGNARERQDPITHKWKFTCQHGPEECVGNLIESCALNLEKNKTTSFLFLHCIEGKDESPDRAAKKCAPKFNVDLDKVMTCANGDQGNQFEHQMALITGQLSPPHDYVPWVTLNGVHTNKIQEEATDDLLSLICKTYTGVKPDACRDHERMILMQQNRCIRA